MKKLLAIFALLCVAVAPLLAQTTPEKSINIIASSLRPVQTDALTGVNIDPIQTDMSNRPCARIKMRVNRMTKAEIAALEIKIIGGNAQVIRRMVADDGNGLIFEVTARENLRFYIQHPEFGESNDVQLAVEGNKEYYLDAELNQLFTIVVASNTADAEIYIDDRFVGRTQKSGSDYLCTVKDALPGEHKLHLKYGGMTTAVQSINVNSASNLFYRQNVNIAGSKPQFVILQVEPKNAVVSIDNQPYAPVDGIVQVLLPNGTHHYSVIASGYHSEQGTFTVEGQKVVKQVSLKSDAATITINAPDADIYINERRVGNGTWSGTLVSGLYLFEARREGYRTQTMSQNITSTQSQQSYTFKPFEPIYGSLTVTSTPALATVTINGKNLGETPLQLNNLLIGNYTVTLSKSGYGNYTTSVVIADGKSENIEAVLPKSSDGVPSNISTLQPATNEVFYTNGSTTVPSKPYNENSFGAKLLSNRYDEVRQCWVLTFDGNVTVVGGWTFNKCRTLRSVNLPKSVTKIVGYSFYECTNLQSVTLPEGLTKIENSAFTKCGKLESITIPSSVTSFGEFAFFQCENLKNVYFNGDLSAWCNIDFEYLGNPCCEGAKLHIQGVEQTEITIPADITKIKENAFYGCTSLTKVTIPESVTAIGEYAFNYCRNIHSIYCRSLTPPVARSGIFNNVSMKRQIYVPSRSLKKYKTAWSQYAADIVGHKF